MWIDWNLGCQEVLHLHVKESSIEAVTQRPYTPLHFSNFMTEVTALKLAITNKVLSQDDGPAVDWL